MWSYLPFWAHLYLCTVCSYASLCVCPSIRPGLWEVRCAPPREYRTMVNIIQDLGIFLACPADYQNCRVSTIPAFLAFPADCRNCWISMIPAFWLKIAEILSSGIFGHSDSCRKCREVARNAAIAENSQILDMYDYGVHHDLRCAPPTWNLATKYHVWIYLSGN